ncbi:DUF4388 domain-containing protein [Acidiferrimicrobium sp. IK]|uniref:DUF4388 domain-containing protein n=1 Tax=Acidiferrimicrobium sp. IK TaxID=2871700 RepID=UPI0021CB7F69|nr:DUF4388 domain-containing protein [Acidiferrimicrobium sp. IK]MCU4184361.1 DUF4388 domain-containing protein [Acidiferrimicrobium sp. IK]
MPLQGTFDVLDFSEVLRLLARQQLTGRLHVRSRSFAANLFLEEGSLVGADQSEHQAAAASGDVRGRLEEICFEMLDAERGGFEFQPGRPSSLPSTTRLRVDTVLSRARKRLQEWQELQELIPSLDLQPHLVDDLSASQVTIDQERWRMLTVVDGRRSLRAISRTLNMSDFDVCRVMKSLLEEGIVELDPRAIALASAAKDAIAPPVAAIDSPAVHEVVRVTTDGGAEAGPAGSPEGRPKGGSRARPTPTPSVKPVAPPSPVPATAAGGPDDRVDPEEDGPGPIDAADGSGSGAVTTESGPVAGAGVPAAGDPAAIDVGVEAAGGPARGGDVGPGGGDTDRNADPGKGRRRRVVRIRSRTSRDGEG